MIVSNDVKLGSKVLARMYERKAITTAIQQATCTLANPEASPQDKGRALILIGDKNDQQQRIAAELANSQNVMTPTMISTEINKTNLFDFHVKPSTVNKLLCAPEEETLTPPVAMREDVIVAGVRKSNFMLTEAGLEYNLGTRNVTGLSGEAVTSSIHWNSCMVDYCIDLIKELQKINPDFLDIIKK